MKDINSDAERWYNQAENDLSHMLDMDFKEDFTRRYVISVTRWLKRR